MNNTIKRVKRVAILGAGASADAGAPVIGNFFKKVKKLIENKKFNPQEIDTFKHVLSMREKLLPDSNIEEFFSYVDFQIHFDVLLAIPSFVTQLMGNVLKRDPENSVPILPDLEQAGLGKNDFKQLKKDISFMICKTLDITLRNTQDEIINVYQKIIDEFDVIISFNWDILCEYAYQRKSGESFSPKQLGFTGWSFLKPALFKLHGSLNWAYCKSCGLYVSDSKIQHKIYEKGVKCPKCEKENLEPLSILPALTKFENIAKTQIPKYGNPYRNMWHAAMQAIVQAEEISFFGYSLSDADMHTKIFFKSGILNNKNKNFKLNVFNKTCDESFKERYINAFKEKAEPKFTSCLFKDY